MVLVSCESLVKTIVEKSYDHFVRPTKQRICWRSNSPLMDFVECVFGRGLTDCTDWSTVMRNVLLRVNRNVRCKPYLLAYTLTVHEQDHRRLSTTHSFEFQNGTCFFYVHAYSSQGHILLVGQTDSQMRPIGTLDLHQCYGTNCKASS